MKHPRASCIVRLCAALAAAPLMAPLACAAQAPQLRPGLWQMNTERTVNGQAAPAGAATLQRMRPEARARVESALKARGVAVPADGSGGVRFCLTREAMARGQFQTQPENGRCTTTFGEQSAARWKWHTTCALPRISGNYVVDGVANFHGPESYSLDITSSSQALGRSNLSTAHMSARWLQADCGDLKPLQPRGVAGTAGQ